MSETFLCQFPLLRSIFSVPVKQTFFAAIFFTASTEIMWVKNKSLSIGSLF